MSTCLKFELILCHLFCPGHSLHRVHTSKSSSDRYASRRRGSTPSGRGRSRRSASGYVVLQSLAKTSSTRMIWLHTSASWRCAQNTGHQHWTLTGFQDRRLPKFYHYKLNNVAGSKEENQGMNSPSQWSQQCPLCAPSWGTCL